MGGKNGGVTAGTVWQVKTGTVAGYAGVTVGGPRIIALHRADHQGEVEWEIHFIDSTIVRAHQHAAGEKGDDEIHARVDGKGRSLHPHARSTADVAETLLNRCSPFRQTWTSPSAPPAFGRRQAYAHASSSSSGDSDPNRSPLNATRTPVATQCHSVSGAEYRGAFFG